MSSPVVSSTAAPIALLSPQSATGAGGSSSAPSQQIDYLKLIVAQMQNLNPLDPSSGQDSLPMLMQAETLNELVRMNQTISASQTMEQAAYATSLLNRTVNAIDASGQQQSGVVVGVQNSTNGIVLQLANGTQIPLTAVSGVASGATAAAGAGSANGD